MGDNTSGMNFFPANYRESSSLGKNSRLNGKIRLAWVFMGQSDQIAPIRHRVKRS
jgi:hypothetical protein